MSRDRPAVALADERPVAPPAPFGSQDASAHCVGIFFLDILANRVKGNHEGHNGHEGGLEAVHHQNAKR